jgi:hypothetical protein
VAYFIVLAQHLHGQTKKNCDNLQDSQSPGWVLNLEPSKYK